jgi:hypothetical protein
MGFGRLRMERRVLKFASYFISLIIILCIIPSGAFASRDEPQINSTVQINSHSYSWKSGSGEDITEGNFNKTQINMLASINKQITQLQSLYMDIGKASNGSEVKKLLSSYKTAKFDQNYTEIYIGPVNIIISSGKEPGKMQTFIFRPENLTEENFKETRDKMLISIENIIQALEKQKADLKASGQESLAEELNTQIIKLQALHTNISKTSDASELKKVLSNYVQFQAAEDVEKEMKSFEAKMGKNRDIDGNITYGNINNEMEEFDAFIKGFDKNEPF